MTETRTETLNDETVVTTTEKIAGSVVAKTIRRTSTGMYSTGAVFGYQPIDVVKTQQFARDASGALVPRNVTMRDVFASSAASRLRGRLRRETQEDATEVSAQHTLGYYDAGDHHFIESGTGAILRVATKRGVRLTATGFEELPGRTTEEVQYELQATRCCQRSPRATSLASRARSFSSREKPPASRRLLLSPELRASSMKTLAALIATKAALRNPRLHLSAPHGTAVTFTRK